MVGLVSWIALSVAFIGGIPGIIGFIDYYKRTSIKIDFDEQQSIACRIDTMNNNLKGKIAILLYRITITGKGLQPAYIREVNIAIKANSKWIEGKRFNPMQSDKTDNMGVTMRAVHLRIQKSKSYDDLYIADWNDFTPGDKGLQYGEPAFFSYASYFDISQQDLEGCKLFRIIITDFLGNEYKEIIDATSITRGFNNIFLIQD